MGNEIESLREKLAVERRVLWIAEGAFFAGAMVPAWGLWMYGWLHPQSVNVSFAVLASVGIGCAMCGWILAKLSVTAFRLYVHRKWRRAHLQRFGRVLHAEPIKRADWK